MQSLNKINFNFLLYFFPLVVLARSATLNIYIISLSLIFIYFYYKSKIKIENEFKKIIVFFFIFYFYLIINSLFAFDVYTSIKSSLSQIRFFLFFLFLYLLCDISREFLEKIIKFYKLILLIFSLDLIAQSILGYNIIGLKPSIDNPDRFSGFFGSELVAGTFLFYISIPIISFTFYQLKKNSLKLNTYNLIFLFLVSFAIIQTGDRMSTLLYLASVIMILFFHLSFKKLLGFIIIIFILLFLTFKLFPNVQSRYISLGNELNNIKSFGYFRLFSSSFNIWKDNKFFGVGLKNYRKVCDTKKFDETTGLKNLCSTHPHNNILELLVETGLIGFILFFLFIFQIIKFLIKKHFLLVSDSIFSSYSFGLLVSLLFFLWPIKSSGSMFTTFFISFTWFNLGILFCLTKNKL